MPSTSFQLFVYKSKLDCPIASEVYGGVTPPKAHRDICFCQLSNWASSKTPEKTQCAVIAQTFLYSIFNFSGGKPRASGKQGVKGFCWCAGCRFAGVVPHQPQSHFRTARPAHCGHDRFGNRIGHGFPSHQQRSPWGTLTTSLLAIFCRYERQDLSRTFLAHHELESVVGVVVIIIIIRR